MQKLTKNFFVNKSKQIGSGNFGVIYRGYYTLQNMVIAVKFVPRSKLDKMSNYTREIEVMTDLAKLKHPNIMGYYGHQEIKEGLYFFLEFCEGGSLKNVIRDKIPDFRAIKFFRQLLYGMIYVNKQNKVHRDLKPDNILLDENDNLKIADFGLTREIKAKMTMLACTPLYAAPEVLNGDAYDSKCDVWSAGLILYNIVTGKELLREIKSKKALEEELSKFIDPNYLQFPVDVHPEWKIIVRSMLIYQKNKRPSFVQILEMFQEAEPKIQKQITPEFKEGDKTISQTVSPFRSRFNPRIDRIDRIQQEQLLYTDLRNVEKFIIFFGQKTDFMIRLVREFTNNSYPYLKNVFKYVLMFLSVSAYICRMKKKLQQFDSHYLKIKDVIYKQEHFVNHEQFRECFKSIISEHKQKFTVSVKKYQKILATQILKKIVKTYMQRPQDNSQVKKFEGLTELIDKTQIQNYSNEESYMKVYRQIMNEKWIGYSESALLQLSHQDLKVYCWIRMIGNLEDVLQDQFYKGRDYVMLHMNIIQQSRTAQLIRFITKYNKF